MTATPLRVLIVDDEPLARDTMRLLLAGCNGVDVVGECANGIEAVERLMAGGVDLVFLDVQMPGMDGLEVVRRVRAERMPAVVFVTAHDEHAVAAFEVEAIDYLLKPVEDDRFASALSRARRRLAGADAAATASRLAALLERRDHPQHDEPWLSLRTPGRLVRVREREVDWIEAADYCVRVHVGADAHLVRDTMAAMESRLDGRRFVRIHRSAIVNVERVREIQPLYHGDFVVILRSGERLRLSRTRRRALEAALKTSL